MRTEGILKAKCTGKNWYTIKTLTLGGIVYNILDAEWCGLTEYWYLTVKAV